MADKITIARPYARAAFEEARAGNHLEDWSQSLKAAAAVVEDARVAALLGNPHVTPAQLAQLVSDIAAPRWVSMARTSCARSPSNGRLAYLPEIAALFDTFKDEAEGVADVTVTSATSLDEAQRGMLAAALERRLKRKVRLHCATDPALIGGAVLRPATWSSTARCARAWRASPTT